MLSKIVLAMIALIGLLGTVVSAGPTVYIRNEEHKYQQDLLPVSSTVIPLSIYKVGYEVNVSDDTKHAKPEEPTKLITASNKKKYSDKTSAKIKVVSKEEFEKRKSEA